MNSEMADKTIGQTLDYCVTRSFEWLEHRTGCPAGRYRVYSWPQVFGSCGDFENEAVPCEAVQAIAVSVNVGTEIIDEYVGVFYDGRPAYFIEGPKPSFWTAMAQYSLPPCDSPNIRKFGRVVHIQKGACARLLERFLDIGSAGVRSPARTR